MRVTMKRLSMLFRGSMFQNVQELNANLRYEAGKTHGIWHANTINYPLGLSVRRAPVRSPRRRGSCFRDYAGQLD